jgi:hypothetical protein
MTSFPLDSLAKHPTRSVSDRPSRYHQTHRASAREALDPVEQLLEVELF